MADDEQVWDRISREQRRKGNPGAAEKAAFLSGQAAYAKPSGPLTPHWNLAQSQAMQAVNNVRFGLADDLTLQRQQMFQDISLSGISSDNKNRLMSSMESQIDPIIDRQLQLDTAQKVAEQDASADVAMRDIAPQIQGIMGDPSMSLEQKFQQTTALQMQYPELIGNKRVDSAFKAANESLRGQQWTRQMSGSSKSVIEQGLEDTAKAGNLKGFDYLLGTLPEEARGNFGDLRKIAEAESFKIDINKERKRILEELFAALQKDDDPDVWRRGAPKAMLESAIEAINDIQGTEYKFGDFVNETGISDLGKLITIINDIRTKDSSPVQKSSPFNLRQKK